MDPLTLLSNKDGAADMLYLCSRDLRASGDSLLDDLLLDGLRMALGLDMHIPFRTDAFYFRALD